MKPKSERPQVPQPMGLILSRQEAIINQPEYRQPWVEPQAIHDAAKAWAEWDNADPFAYSRKTLHMRQGFELVSDVRHDAMSKLNARRAQAMEDTHAPVA